LRRRLAAVALVVATAPGALAGKAPPVGVTTLTFTKTSVSNGQPRVLTTVIWYPAARGTGTAEALGLRDADVRSGRFPLVVFSHGTCGRPTEASYLTMAIAAQGFVVAAPPHPGNTADDFPGCLGGLPFIDSAVNRVPDVRFVIDSMLAEGASGASRFSGRLRSDAIGVTGLSFGGFTTLLAAQLEPRLRAALALVPGGTASLQPGDITIPTMVIGSEHDEVVTFAESEKAYQRLAGPRFLVELLGGTHLSVTDDCTPLCHLDAPSQAKAHRLVLHYALPFLRHYVARDGGVSSLSRKIRGVKVTAEARRP
jgi:predicted dienelactone hydrolase